MNRLRSFFKETLLPLTAVVGVIAVFLLFADLIYRYQDVARVVIGNIGIGLISGGILYFYIYMSRLIRWDLQNRDFGPKTYGDKLEYLRKKQYNVGYTYRSWLNSAGSSAMFEFTFTGAITAFVIGLFFDAFKKTQSWRELLTIDYIYLFIIGGALICGCAIAASSWLSMDRQFKRKIERLGKLIEVEFQRMQENSD